MEGRSRALSPEQVEAVKAEIDRQRIPDGLREKIGNHRTPEDYALLITKARGDYGAPARRESRLARALEIGGALIACGWEHIRRGRM